MGVPLTANRRAEWRASTLKEDHSLLGFNAFQTSSRSGSYPLLCLFAKHTGTPHWEKICSHLLSPCPCPRTPPRMLGNTLGNAYNSTASGNA